ncbi:MAG: TIGR03016 family PEP-CTERM system-associated outer membrane protein [Betaproteobacteria bacterium]
MKSRGSTGAARRPHPAGRWPAFSALSSSATARLLAAALTFAAAPASAQSWHFESSVSVKETATDNVNLQPSETKQSDWVTELRPSLRISEKGARTSLSGLLVVPVLLYVRTGSENSNAYPTADVLGDARLIDDWLHVEGQVLVSQQYFNPFGGQPLGIDNATQNRYRSDTYRISPYVKGVTPDNVTYELRNNDVWTNLSGAPISTSNFHYTQFTGKAAKTETTIGWQAEFDVNDIAVSDGESFRSRVVRLMPLYNVDPQLRLAATVGYEDNHYPPDNPRDAIYGVGFEWRPTPRTKVVGSWEHRFFGPKYLFSFDHRTPLSVWTVRVARDISTYPQQLASLPAGGDVSTLLNGLFLATIPDPAERQRTIDQFILDRSLPSVLSGALNLYSQQVLLQQSQTASVGLVGTRNTVLLTIFNLRSEPITGSGSELTQLFTIGNNSRQTGLSLLWSRNLTPSLVFDATIDRLRTVANAPLEGRTNQTALRLVLSSPLSAKTTLFAGARYQTLSSDVAADYNEAAAFVGVTHVFR